MYDSVPVSLLLCHLLPDFSMFKLVATLAGMHAVHGTLLLIVTGVVELLLLGQCFAQFIM